jgi:deoxyribonuclease V
MQTDQNSSSPLLPRAYGLLSERRLARLISFQKKVASKVVLEDHFTEDILAGVDQAFFSSSGREHIISGAVALSSSMQVLGTASHQSQAKFPYIPGLLSFREGPAAIRAVASLSPRPGLLFVDGCGINHPLRAGLASYIGIALDIPTVGITKGVLCGDFELPELEGSAVPLTFEEKQVGYVLKSGKGCRPIVVGPGHKVSLESSLCLARKYIRGHKLPEPCRLAHEHANLEKKVIAAKLGKIGAPG